MRVGQGPVGTHRADPHPPAHKDSSGLLCIWVSLASSTSWRTASFPWTDTYLIQGSFLCKNTFLKLVRRLEAVLCVSLLKKKQHLEKKKKRQNFSCQLE